MSDSSDTDGLLDAIKNILEELRLLSIRVAKPNGKTKTEHGRRVCKEKPGRIFKKHRSAEWRGNKV